MESSDLEILKSIKQVEISEEVFKKLTSRIQERKSQIIPFDKIGVAASLLMGFLIFEIYFLNKKIKDNAPHEVELVTLNNNHLYNE